MTTKHGSRKAVRLGKFHDRYHLLHEDFRRDLLPLLDMGNVAEAQIAELAESLVTCLYIRRRELDGYDPDAVINS